MLEDNILYIRVLFEKYFVVGSLVIWMYYITFIILLKWQFSCIKLCYSSLYITNLSFAYELKNKLYVQYM